MILMLDHTNNEIAQDIRAVFQVSYTIEAKLLNANNFPPLHRKLNEFIESETLFYGYYKAEFLAAIIEIKQNEYSIHIQSLVVHPKCFRQGLASNLLRFVIAKYEVRIFTVETGLANEPAKRLYQGFDFQKTKEWDTDHGVRKVAFKLIR